MTVIFENLNNNDTEHEIIFLSLTKYASGTEEIKVLFDGYKHTSNVYCERGHKYFKWCGKRYNFYIPK